MEVVYDEFIDQVLGSIISASPSAYAEVVAAMETKISDFEVQNRLITHGELKAQNLLPKPITVLRGSYIE